MIRGLFGFQFLKKIHRRKNILIGLIVGMALPVIIVIILDSVNNKIRSRKDIEVMTSIPILGGIGTSKEEGFQKEVLLSQIKQGT